VEPLLDAAHALSIQCRRNLAIRKLNEEESREKEIEVSRPKKDPFRAIHKRQEYHEPDLRKIPLEPDEDILLFIRDHNPHLSEWERDVLSIVHERSQYFIPQIETKIMNEGWASYWHKKIIDALDLPQKMKLEFAVRHNQVLRPTPIGINPYRMGMKIWENIKRRWDQPSPEEIREYGPRTRSGDQKIFEVREVERDTSFLRRYLTEDLVRELNLFEYETRGNEQVITQVAEKENWRSIKETLIRDVGLGHVPVIKVEDADHKGNRVLYLKHDHDGRDLQLEYAERTLKYLQQLWQWDVVLETVVHGKKSLLRVTNDKFSLKPLS
jgi:stage V sporulation protein R